jgi:hypothetical protein
MNRTDILNFLIKKYSFNKYLEIGVRDSNENFNKIIINDKDGVDPFPVTPVKYQVSSDLFFSDYVNNKKYDIIFVDGLHTSEQVYKDIKNSLMCLNDGGFIIIHDCNPTQEYHTRSYDEYLKHRGIWNGDVFKGFIKIKKELPEYSCFVVNEDYGCGIITKQHILKNKTFDLDINDINWKLFDINRVNLLQLIEYDEFIKLF